MRIFAALPLLFGNASRISTGDFQKLIAQAATRRGALLIANKLILARALRYIALMIMV